MPFMRIFGGQVGVAAMTRFIAVREQFHDNMLGLYVQRGSWLTDQRVRMLAAGVRPQSIDGKEALQRAGDILGLQVRAQAYTLATSDGFVLIVWVVIIYLFIMLLLRPGKITFNDLRKMP
jgi:DHA2 family multidrug resistance protein